MITKTERAELRSLINQRFKVLEADVEQRHKELLAEMEVKIGESFDDDIRQWADVGHLIHEAVMEANRVANDAFRNLVGETWQELNLIRSASVEEIRRAAGGQTLQDKAQARREQSTKIEALVKAAMLELARQKVDLLSELATGALESDEARAFLGRIPTVGQLIPASRMPELEQ